MIWTTTQKKNKRVIKVHTWMLSLCPWREQKGRKKKAPRKKLAQEGEPHCLSLSRWTAHTRLHTFGLPLSTVATKGATAAALKSVRECGGPSERKERKKYLYNEERILTYTTQTSLRREHTFKEACFVTTSCPSSVCQLAAARKTRMRMEKSSKALEKYKDEGEGARKLYKPEKPSVEPHSLFSGKKKH